MPVQQLDMKETRSEKLIEKQEQREGTDRPEDPLTGATSTELRQKLSRIAGQKPN